MLQCDLCHSKIIGSKFKKIILFDDGLTYDLCFDCLSFADKLLENYQSPHEVTPVDVAQINAQVEQIVRNLGTLDRFETPKIRVRFDCQVTIQIKMDKRSQWILVWKGSRGNSYLHVFRPGKWMNYLHKLSLLAHYQKMKIEQENYSPIDDHGTFSDDEILPDAPACYFKEIGTTAHLICPKCDATCHYCPKCKQNWTCPNCNPIIESKAICYDCYRIAPEKKA